MKKNSFEAAASLIEMATLVALLSIASIVAIQR